MFLCAKPLDVCYCGVRAGLSGAWCLAVSVQDCPEGVFFKTSIACCDYDVAAASCMPLEAARVSSFAMRANLAHWF